MTISQYIEHLKSHNPNDAWWVRDLRRRMLRKPIEIESEMLAIGATEASKQRARRQTDEGVAAQWPGYRCVSEREYTQGKLLHIARRYEYSRLSVLKNWVLRKLGRPERQAEPIRGL